MSRYNYFVRPISCDFFDSRNLKIDDEKGKIMIKSQQNIHDSNMFLEYKPNGILNNMSQREVFRIAVKGNIKTCLENKNADLIIMSIGQTCSGKSFTIMGAKEMPGIVPRVLSALMKWKNSSSSKYRYITINLSYIENSTTGNGFYDLLSNKRKIDCLQDIKCVKLTNEKTNDFLKQSILLSDKRKTAEWNDSKAANTIITFNVKTYGKSQNEAGESNISMLSTCRIHCIDTIGLDQKHGVGLDLIKNYTELISHVNGRDKIRQPFLRRYFGSRLNQSHLITVAHISFKEDHLKNTISTLRSASLSLGNLVQLHSPQEEKNKQIEELKFKNKNILRSFTTYDLAYDAGFLPSFNIQSEHDQILTSATQYFNKEIPLLKYTDIESLHLILRVFKNMYWDLLNRKPEYPPHPKKITFKHKEGSLSKKQRGKEKKNKQKEEKDKKGEKRKKELDDKSKNDKNDKKKKDKKKNKDDKKKKDKKKNKDDKEQIKKKEKPEKHVTWGDLKRHRRKSKKSKTKRRFKVFLKIEIVKEILNQIKQLRNDRKKLNLELKKAIRVYNGSQIDGMMLKLELIAHAQGRQKERKCGDKMGLDFNRSLKGRDLKLEGKLEKITQQETQQKKMFQEIQELMHLFLNQQRTLRKLRNNIDDEYKKPLPRRKKSILRQPKSILKKHQDK